MNYFRKLFRRAKSPKSLLRDQRGLSTVEYVILLVLIAASAITLWVTFGTSIRTKIAAANTEMEGVKIGKDH